MSGVPALSFRGPPTVTLAYRSTDGQAALPLEEAWDLLPAGEQARAARFHFQRDRHRWIKGRAWIRKELGGVLGVSPQRLELTAEPGGRLFIPGAPIDFNLSHTGGWIALAICQGGKVGLDIETIDPTFPAREIASTFFHPDEYKWIAPGPIGRFFQVWTAKEALMKATGRGMSLEPDKILVSIHHGQPVTVTNLENGDTWPVHFWSGPEGTVAAVVHLAAP